MRKGKGQITYGQLKRLYEIERRRNGALTKTIRSKDDKILALQRQLDKMYKQKECLDAMPSVKSALQGVEGILGVLGGMRY